jgi:hypothetical protein
MSSFAITARGKLVALSAADGISDRPNRGFTMPIWFAGRKHGTARHRTCAAGSMT